MRLGMGREAQRREIDDRDDGVRRCVDDRDFPRRLIGDVNENRRQQNDQDNASEKIEQQLGQTLPGGLRRGTKDQNRPAIKIIEAGPGDLGTEEVRHQPGFHPFDLASLDRLFNLSEVSVLGIEDDPAGRPFMQ